MLASASSPRVFALVAALMGVALCLLALERYSLVPGIDLDLCAQPVPAISQTLGLSSSPARLGTNEGADAGYGDATADDACWHFPPSDNDAPFALEICAPAVPSTGRSAFLVLRRTTPAAPFDLLGIDDSELAAWAAQYGPDSTYVRWEYDGLIGAVEDEALFLPDEGAWEYDLKAVGDGHDVAHGGRLRLNIIWSYANYSYAWPQPRYPIRPNALVFPSLPDPDTLASAVPAGLLPRAADLSPAAFRPLRSLRPCSRFAPAQGRYVASGFALGSYPVADRELEYVFQNDGCTVVEPPIPRLTGEGAAPDGPPSAHWTKGRERRIMFLGESHATNLGKAFIKTFNPPGHEKFTFDKHSPNEAVLDNLTVATNFSPWLAKNWDCAHFLPFDSIVLSGGHHWLCGAKDTDEPRYKPDRYDHLWSPAEAAAYVTWRVESILTCFEEAKQPAPRLIVMSAPAKDALSNQRSLIDARSNVRLAAFRDHLFAALRPRFPSVRLVDQYLFSLPFLHTSLDHNHLNDVPLRAVLADTVYKLELVDAPVDEELVDPVEELALAE